MLHSKLKIMKAELKVLALEIRRLKSLRKDKTVTRTGQVPGLGTAQWQFRIKHIARCMLRGRTLEQIEPKLKNPDSYENRNIRKEALALVASITKEVNTQPTEESNEKDICTDRQEPVEIAASSTVWTRLVKSIL